jgi:hypothetical protein
MRDLPFPYLSPFVGRGCTALESLKEQTPGSAKTCKVRGFYAFLVVFEEAGARLTAEAAGGHVLA